MAQVVLYDTPNRQGNCWSPNIWIARLLLNFKGTDYRTEWVDFQDVESTFKSLGIPPHPPRIQVSEYPISVLHLEDGYHWGSKAIAKELEKLYPEPSARLLSTTLQKVEVACTAIVKPLTPIVAPITPRTILAGPSIDAYREVRRKDFGMSLEEFEEGHGGEPAWEKVLPGLRKLGEILKEDSSGPFCLGDSPSYADFLIVGILQWCRCVQEDVFERMIEADVSLAELCKACEPWLKRNN